MTAPTMNGLIHHAVRRDLARLAAALDPWPDGDRARAQRLERAFANLRRELTHHHEGEDEHVWPFLARTGVEAGLLAEMEAEHGAMSAALAGTATALSRLAQSGSADDAAAARESVEGTRTVVEAHFDHEEKELEPLLRSHEGTPEWKAVTDQLRHRSPGDAGSFFAWLTDGISDEDRAALKATVPAPLTFVLSRALGRRYTKEIAPVWR
ncbi:hemerythrin domain-containing protein [Petropleomorpha daqingensis]|uniref:Hemerythrin-like domain-containing protein n=1 Tax=Petropleomorpha daqingensis TaxID=2026353 RepID=A0A853CRQ0_9ACTN|nr:hemerythrin domain-containing protein [Petropleomorpha daqingensis]NYJ08818.1 hemerythrin-like domain-containing protein [Petropleomorpha daqingensis]